MPLDLHAIRRHFSSSNVLLIIEYGIFLTGICIKFVILKKKVSIVIVCENIYGRFS